MMDKHEQVKYQDISSLITHYFQGEEVEQHWLKLEDR